MAINKQTIARNLLKILLIILTSYNRPCGWA
jgi:hypothetical protein